MYIYIISKIKHLTILKTVLFAPLDYIVVTPASYFVDTFLGNNLLFITKI